MEDDHIPLKDQFSADQSQIDIDDKQQQQRAYPTVSNNKIKKIKKKSKNFVWKYKWIKIPNAVSNSAPILIRSWVKIKLEHQESSAQEEEEVRKPYLNQKKEKREIEVKQRLEEDGQEDEEGDVDQDEGDGEEEGDGDGDGVQGSNQQQED